VAGAEFSLQFVELVAGEVGSRAASPLTTQLQLLLLLLLSAWMTGMINRRRPSMMFQTFA